MRIWRSMFDDANREAILRRLRSLNAATPPRWGRMRAPQMVAHLTDQMSHTLGDVPVRPRPGPLRNRFVRWASIYWVSWPKGKIQGPPEAFVSNPGEWSEDVERLASLVERFARRGPLADWPEHALFGPMTGRDWGVFCHKHFDHHLRQFGA